jgi:hypothetical protein
VCHISDRLCDSTYFITYFMVLVYVLSEIMMGYKISHKEMCYLVKRIWHTVCCAS